MYQSVATIVAHLVEPWHVNHFYSVHYSQLGVLFFVKHHEIVSSKAAVLKLCAASNLHFATSC